MIKIRFLPTFVAFVVCLSAVAASAQDKQMYQYTDENGTVVFTDQKPVNQEVKSQAIPSGPAPQGDNPYASANQPSEPSAADLRRAEIAQGKQQSHQTQAINQAQCAAWQAEVDRLEPHRRVFLHPGSALDQRHTVPSGFEEQENWRYPHWH